MDDRELHEYAHVNRTRIEGVEREVDRMRQRMHELESTASVIRWYGEKVDNVARQIADLAEKLDHLSRRAVERPRVSTVAVLVQLGSLGVAMVALVLALSR